MLVIRLPLIAPTVVPRRSREQLLIGFIAATELRYQRCSLLPAELHHCAAATADDEHSGLGGAVVERILVDAQRRHSPVGAPITVDLMSISPTRADNLAMRSIFFRTGWTKEAHYRRAWPVEGREPQDTVVYAILREEWESGKVRGLQWHDRPQFAPEHSSDVAFESNAVPTVDELTALYQSVGWSAYSRDPASLHVSVMASAHVVTARHDGEVVGLARVISDFGSIVYLQDVLVHPDHQRRGIGRLLVERVLRPFSEVRQTVLLTDADPALTAFYVSLGFHEVSGSLQTDMRAFM